MHFSLYSVPNITVGLLTLTLGLIVFFRNPRSVTNFAFLGFCGSMSIQLLSYGLVYSTQDLSIALPLAKIGHAAVILASPFYFLFCISFLKRKKQIPILIGIVLATLALIYLIFFTNLYFSELKPHFWGYYPKGTWLILIDFIIHAIVITKCITLYIDSYRECKKNNDFAMCNRIKYVGFSFGIILFVLIDYFPKYFDNVYPSGYVPTLIFVVVTSVAIIKHNLMDIDFVIRKSLIYSLLATVITIMYFILVVLTESIFRGFVGYRSITLTIVMIVLFTLIFQPLKNRIQSFVDKVFFRKTRSAIMRENERLVEQLQRSEKMRAVGNLAAGLAHEIKNPLTAIKTFTEFLEEKHADEAFRKKFKNIVGSEVDRINNIVQQLLDFAKPKAPSLRSTNINKVLDDTLNLLSSDILKKRISMTKSFYADTITVNADANQLKQVFLNIILNAIDSMKSGGQLIVSVQPKDSKVSIKISDTGSGISKQNIPHIFDPFYSTKDTGTGLGLSVVHNIIKEHGGIITVESEIGKGTTFEIII